MRDHAHTLSDFCAPTLSIECELPAAHEPLHTGMLWHTHPARLRRTPPAGFFQPCQPTRAPRPFKAAAIWRSDFAPAA